MFEAITFATKAQPPLVMIELAIRAEVPFARAATDNTYGVGEIEVAVRRADKSDVAGVTSQPHSLSWDAALDVAGNGAQIVKGIPHQDRLRYLADSAPREPAVRLH